MAELLLLAKEQNGELDPTRRRIGTFFPDIFTSESVEYANSITSQPIETGESIQDHVFREPLVIELTGVHGNVAVDIISEDGSVEVDEGRSLLAYEVLLELYQRKTPFDVVIGLGQVVDMLVERINFVESTDTGDALNFTVRLKQITLVDSEVTESNRRVVMPAKAPKVSKKAGSPTGKPEIKGRVRGVLVQPIQANKAIPSVNKASGVFPSTTGISVNPAVERLKKLRGSLGQ
jgi:hypothetical protein